MSTFKITLKFEDWDAVEASTLHLNKARKHGVNLAEMRERREDSVRYQVVFVKARNESHARRVATEEHGGGYVLDCERMDW